MRFFYIKKILLVILPLFPLSLGYSIVLKYGDHECFYEKMKKNEKLTISYQASSNEYEEEMLFVTFDVWDPEEKTLKTENSLFYDEFSINADIEGKYKYCFSNKVHHNLDIELFFNVHHIKDTHIAEDASDFNREVAFLNEVLMDIRDEQEYLKAREKVHRSIAENTNSRVQNWNIFQIIILISLVLFQVYFLRKFFEVKRII
ncbi:hypothetical protein PNEG_03489 [Pneumocystis murina B123]|uniref:GOLD domain-containing protein n=1 Tax=Pneumocystis murina (strain B123) TaxID=1069680 RepID=M7NLH1_PNEMU|nr:hypothetical protein PNEG_03489 [Pneumocystis murina B123]EMR08047.1 hypothetical protein PNEG_03489 [Pneumocystis murina B123]